MVKRAKVRYLVFDIHYGKPSPFSLMNELNAIIAKLYGLLLYAKYKPQLVLFDETTCTGILRTTNEALPYLRASFLLLKSAYLHVHKVTGTALKAKKLWKNLYAAKSSSLANA